MQGLAAPTAAAAGPFKYPH
ncbi:hypothetical protein HaLaN_08459 [Haematococcus lacustris]|uniref:Uncharacterized protein n=1 Tax=Haematococcus lacustris TaxID=44745 RepID=A0A699YSB2_HAELA|nr:hypothetical protein HaLaN_08459 [Haematococcus lacustris]